jgi:hypothetical protein
MRITFADVFPLLAEPLSGFEASPEDWEEHAAYCFLGDMVRFVCDRAYPQFPDNKSLLRQFAALMERLISEGDRDVHDLAHDALESVWAREEREFVASYFGPETTELWARICSGERGQ